MILIGFMGAGKSTIARLLGKELGRPFIDIDTEIEKNLEMSISEYFAQRGETAFRQIELEVLKLALTTERIISTGGGCIETAAVRSLLKERQDVIFLRCSFDLLYERVTREAVASLRPLVNQKTKSELTALYESRLGYYQEVAQITIDTDALTPIEIVEEIQQLVHN
ncbi:AAA family ATPase [Aerococcaceae bacterium WS4759]|uniref:Shikimate kinase n=1 Tax=Fundicoccus ignavus TaxID=2664442 RepID=A0A6I2GKM8_9LACT|nr:shikimate kinase [Fundicoccus ignavus]MRI86412.1 AAA family ATPase [Fundicoccus ignavus]